MKVKFSEKCTLYALVYYMETILVWIKNNFVLMLLKAGFSIFSLHFYTNSPHIDITDI